MRICVQENSFEPAAELSGFGEQDGVGAVVHFIGIVRDDGGLDHMNIEHYPAMTDAALTEIAQKAISRWDLLDCLIIHRFGPMKPKERIMMVATAAPHRKAAFEAAEFLMDYLKSRAPFWKKEVTVDGRSTWVDAKTDDETALTRW